MSDQGLRADSESALARRVPAEWWRTVFGAGSLYLMTDGDVVENAAITRSEVDVLIAAARLAPHHRILDLCCGQGRHALELAQRGFALVCGADQSAWLLGIARERADALGLKLALLEGDARACVREQPPFDRIYMMGNSFGYFEHVADDRALLDAIRRALAPGGTLTLDIVDGGWLRSRLVPRSFEWIDAQHLACREREITADGDRVVTREIILHGRDGIVADQYYGQRLYTRDRICALLREAGFGPVEFHSNLRLDGQDGRDPGQMQNRLLLTASPRAEISGRDGGAAAAKPVVMVLLGDPGLPDKVKNGGRFNFEDMDAVARLRAALASIDGYSFYYVESHEGLIDRLRSDRPALVFNLCDEGFGNDPAMELHVPALLEMLEIGYTGAPPACLAACYDKSLVRALALSMNIAVPDEVCLPERAPLGTLHAAKPPFPLFVKPARADGSYGIRAQSVVVTDAQLRDALQWLDELNAGPSLVQEFLPGTEYSLGIIGNVDTGLELLPAIEVDYAGLPGGPPIQCYASKWDPSFWTNIRLQEANVQDQQLRAMQDASVALFGALGCRDYARFDFRTDANGIIKLLEVNPNASWCSDSKLAVMAEIAGISYSEMLRKILDCAWRRTR
ncbi:MAG: methyltransferase domain-containing protein [Xanthobacteraceae bacterium]